jgi:hypothetical protein
VEDGAIWEEELCKMCWSALHEAHAFRHYLFGHGSTDLLSPLEPYLPRGERLGEVLAATHEAACQRAIHRFRIKPEERQELEVRRASD